MEDIFFNKDALLSFFETSSESSDSNKSLMILICSWFIGQYLGKRQEKFKLTDIYNPIEDALKVYEDIKNCDKEEYTLPRLFEKQILFKINVFKAKALNTIYYPIEEYKIKKLPLYYLFYLILKRSVPEQHIALLTLYDLSYLILKRIVDSHIFTDGNKRTAFIYIEFIVALYKKTIYLQDNSTYEIYKQFEKILENIVMAKNPKSEKKVKKELFSFFNKYLKDVSTIGTKEQDKNQENKKQK